MDHGIEQLIRYCRVKAATDALKSDAVECPRCNGSGHLFIFFRCNTCKGFKRVSLETDKMVREYDEVIEHENAVIKMAKRL